MGYWRLAQVPNGYSFTQRELQKRITEPSEIVTEYLGDVIMEMTREGLPEYINDLYDDSDAYDILSEREGYIDENIDGFDDLYEEIEITITDRIHPGDDFRIKGFVFQWIDASENRKPKARTVNGKRIKNRRGKR